jgi:hypothetical protein
MRINLYRKKPSLGAHTRPSGDWNERINKTPLATNLHKIKKRSSGDTSLAQILIRA